MTTSWAATARVLRCAGFGTTGAAVDAATRVPGLAASLVGADPASDRGATATPLPSYDPVPPVGKGATTAERKARDQQISTQVADLTAWWVRRMVAVEQPSLERLTFGWHDHFATGAAKVRSANDLAKQNETLRTAGRGDFRALALAMLTDGAMLRWLDGETSTVKAPNENLSREFMELFALGHGDGYTETDVREGARALTGWQVRPDGSTFLTAKRHDAGTKTFLGVTGNLDHVGYADAVLARPASPGFVAGRWWRQLASDQPPSADLLARLVAAYGPQRSLSGLFTAILSAPELPAAAGTRVVGPVEWLVGAVRALRVPVPDAAHAKPLVAILRALGQVPFAPPSVGGWPSGQAWLSTAAVDTRMRTAVSLARTGDVSAVADQPVAARVDATAHLLGIASWSDATAAVLRGQTDPHRLVAVALTSPEYVTV